MKPLNAYDRALIAQALQHFSHYLRCDPVLSLSAGNVKRADRCLELAMDFRVKPQLTVVKDGLMQRTKRDFYDEPKDDD